MPITMGSPGGSGAAVVTPACEQHCHTSPSRWAAGAGRSVSCVLRPGPRWRDPTHDRGNSPRCPGTAAAKGNPEPGTCSKLSHSYSWQTYFGCKRCQNHSLQFSCAVGSVPFLGAAGFVAPSHDHPLRTSLGLELLRGTRYPQIAAVWGRFSSI